MMDLRFYRRRMEIIDEKLLPLLQERMALSAEIGRWKAENGVPVYDEARETALLQSLRRRSAPEYADDVIRLYRLILILSKQRQGWHGDE